MSIVERFHLLTEHPSEQRSLGTLALLQRPPRQMVADFTPSISLETIESSFSYLHTLQAMTVNN